jgi:hypothetical protein
MPAEVGQTVEVRSTPAVWIHTFTRDIGIRCRFVIRTDRLATARDLRKSQLVLPTLT